MHNAVDEDLSGRGGVAERPVWSGGSSWSFMATDSSGTRDAFAIAIICQSLAD